ncbi:hypothetical protein GX48_03502 [Paracoccidioides brasiliensis]|nr:hypothetical protein GX48_03502 [Paracoccidioides brasiliensis]
MQVSRRWGEGGLFYRRVKRVRSFDAHGDKALGEMCRCRVAGLRYAKAARQRMPREADNLTVSWVKQETQHEEDEEDEEDERERRRRKTGQVSRWD